MANPGRTVLALLAAVGTSIVVLGIAAVIAFVLMIAANGFSEAQAMPFAIAFLVVVALTNTACTAIVAHTVRSGRERGGWPLPIAMGVVCTAAPVMIMVGMHWLPG